MNDFYKRQIILPFVGISGQEKLSNSKVLIVGAGGLGHPSALYLAGSGIGTIGILDFDKIELSNLHRQVVFTIEDIGLYKSEVLTKRIKEQNSAINVISHIDYLAFNNIEQIFREYNLILDCCDNLDTKFLIHDFCYKLKKVLIQGSIDQIEGEIKLFNFQSQDENIPCLRCLWNTVPEKDCIGSCLENGVLPTTAGVFGTLMANEVLKYILETTHLNNGESFIFNLQSLDTIKIKWKKNKNCPLCSINNSLDLSLHPFELSYFELKNLNEYQIIDLRINSLLTSNIDSLKKYLLICDKGIASFRHAKILRAEGFNNVWSLNGGANCLSLV